MKLRAGRGFTKQELAAAGVRRKEALSLGIPVDHRRRNASEEGLKINVERLQAYKGRLVVFPKKAGKVKKGDTEVSGSSQSTVSSLYSSVSLVLFYTSNLSMYQLALSTMHQIIRRLYITTPLDYHSPSNSPPFYPTLSSLFLSLPLRSYRVPTSPPSVSPRSPPLSPSPPVSPTKSPARSLRTRRTSLLSVLSVLPVRMLVSLVYVPRGRRRLRRRRLPRRR